MKIFVHSYPLLSSSDLYRDATTTMTLHTTPTMNPAPPQLSNITPPLPPSLLANLSTLSIHTAPDLIFAPPAELLRKLPAGSITFPELTHHIAHVRNAFAGPALTGDQLIRELEARARLPSVRSGLPALDSLVGDSFGGASGGRVVEISGASASGKTVRARCPGCPHSSYPFVDDVVDYMYKLRALLIVCLFRHLHCTSSFITSGCTRPMPHSGSTPRVTSLRRVSPRSCRVRAMNQSVQRHH